jgi:hypothetical protein
MSHAKLLPGLTKEQKRWLALIQVVIGTWKIRDFDIVSEPAGQRQFR